MTTTEEQSLRAWMLEEWWAQQDRDDERERRERALSGTQDLSLSPVPRPNREPVEQTAPKRKSLDQKMRDRGWDEESALLGGMLAGLILIPALLFGGIMLFAEPGTEPTPGISEVQP